ncbi:helix-turn-helix domain-containing protein [Marinoscillum sp.]|uniref:helix-turn-helix domain-containing protein n=1 Tax=Marinoscillum sp. TaxID=2024838 RepID=UPI003BAC3159
MPKSKNVKPYANPIDIEVGKKLRIIRRLRNFSQPALAEEVGISFQQIQKYENGKNRISASRLYSFSQILEVDINEFFSAQDNLNTLHPELHITNLDEQALNMVYLFKSISNDEVKNNLLKLLMSMAAEK